MKKCDTEYDKTPPPPQKKGSWLINAFRYLLFGGLLYYLSVYIVAGMIKKNSLKKTRL